MEKNNQQDPPLMNPPPQRCWPSICEQPLWRSPNRVAAGEMGLKLFLCLFFFFFGPSQNRSGSHTRTQQHQARPRISSSIYLVSLIRAKQRRSSSSMKRLESSELVDREEEKNMQPTQKQDTPLDSPPVLMNGSPRLVLLFASDRSVRIQRTFSIDSLSHICKQPADTRSPNKAAGKRNQLILFENDC